MESEPNLRGVVHFPERLGRHEIVAHLGRGGMAQVYLAVQHGPFGSNKLVVIKKLKSDPSDDSQFLAMFVDEARIAMRLSHPNIVNTFDFVTNSEEAYLIMEYLEGQSLLQLLRKLGRDDMPLHLHIWILTQVLVGLGYAHTLRDFDGTPLAIVHRDVTPSNVIVTYGGEVKLVDFGIAKVAGAVAVTGSGMMKGKLGYASPEQCLGLTTSARSDLYSVGVMLWEAMARKRRTLGQTPAEIFQARIQGQDLNIEEAWLEAPPALVAVVRRALAADPANRHSNAREFQHHLEEYLTASRATVGPRAMADFMATHFAADIKVLRKTIEARVADAVKTLQSVAPGAEVTGTSHKLSSGSQDQDVTVAVPPTGPLAAALRDAAVREPAPMVAAPRWRPGRAALSAGVVGASILVMIAVAALQRAGSHPGASSAERSASAKGTDPVAVEPRMGSAMGAGLGATKRPETGQQKPAQKGAAMVVALPSAAATPGPAPSRAAVNPSRAPQRPARGNAASGKRMGAGMGESDSDVEGARRAAVARPTGNAHELRGTARTAGQPDEAAPGTDLRQLVRSPAGTARHIDEKDPYTP